MYKSQLSKIDPYLGWIGFVVQGHICHCIILSIWFFNEDVSNMSSFIQQNFDREYQRSHVYYTVG